jgi:hypothetical protein
MYINEGAMERIERLRTRAEGNGRAVISGAKPPSVEAVGGQANRGFEGSSQPGDEGLLLWAPCRQGGDPDGHQCLAAVLEVETPLHEAAMRVMREANASARAGEGVPHA